MTRRKSVASLVLSSLFISSVTVAQDGMRIRARVIGADAAQGQILGSLFNSGGSYMREPIQRIDAQVDISGSATLDFGTHSPGEYAVVVIYDRDNDGELGTGFLGIPNEKVGFSNNARGRFGPAKWEHARFEVSDADTNVEINLKPAKE